MENKLARFMKATGKMRFFIPVGVLLIVMGILMLSMTPKEYGETTGVITAVNEYTGTDADNHAVTLYEAEFTYTVDGKEYQNSFPDYPEPPEIGAIFQLTANSTSKMTAMPKAGTLLRNSDTGIRTLSNPC